MLRRTRSEDATCFSGLLTSIVRILLFRGVGDKVGLPVGNGWFELVMERCSCCAVCCGSTAEWLASSIDMMNLKKLLAATQGIIAIDLMAR